MAEFEYMPEPDDPPPYPVIAHGPTCVCETCWGTRKPCGTGRCSGCNQPIDRHEIVDPLAGCPPSKTH